MSSRPSKRSRREAAKHAALRRQRMKWGGIVTALVLGIGVFAIFGGGGDSAPAMASDFELSGPDGETVRLSDFRGQPVAVTFMHTW
jgi:hypothetical protein